MKTHDLAVQLVELLRDRMKTGNRAPIVGYTKMASMLGWRGGENFGRSAGMVTSIVDYACFIAGMPMLATYYVRSADGSINSAAFNGGWEPYKEEIVSVADAHNWSGDDFDLVLRTLATLPRCSDKVLWRDAHERGEKFIRYNLHRRVGTAA